MWNLKASIRALASSLGIIKQKRALLLWSNLVWATTLHTHLQALNVQEQGSLMDDEAPPGQELEMLNTATIGGLKPETVGEKTEESFLGKLCGRHRASIKGFPS